jgi:hypothetical protein
MLWLKHRRVLHALAVLLVGGAMLTATAQYAVDSPKPDAPVADETKPNPADRMPVLSEQCVQACQLALDDSINSCPGPTARAAERAAVPPPRDCVPKSISRFESCLNACPLR